MNFFCSQHQSYCNRFDNKVTVFQVPYQEKVEAGRRKPVPKPRRGPTRKDTRVQQLARSSVWTDGLVTCVRCPCVVTSVTPSMVTVSSLGSASVTSDTRAPAAGTVSSCPGVSTGTAPRASPATASRAGPGCSATTPSATRTV